MHGRSIPVCIQAQQRYGRGRRRRDGVLNLPRNEVDSLSGIARSVEDFFYFLQRSVCALNVGILAQFLRSTLSQEIDVIFGRICHALKGVKEIQVSANILLIEKNPRGGRHATASPT